jgi:hypothetical protein
MAVKVNLLNGQSFTIQEAGRFDVAFKMLRLWRAGGGQKQPLLSIKLELLHSQKKTNKKGWEKF